MRFSILILGLIFFCSFQLSAQYFDNITVTLIRHDNTGKRSFEDWTLKDDPLKSGLANGKALISGHDSTFIIKACPTEYCYKLYNVADQNTLSSQYEVIIARNGEVLPLVYNSGSKNRELHFSPDKENWQKSKSAFHNNETSSLLTVTPQFVQLKLERFVRGTFIDVLAADGTVIHSSEVDHANVHLDSTAWPEGNYLIVCRSENYNSVVASVRHVKS